MQLLQLFLLKKDALHAVHDFFLAIVKFGEQVLVLSLNLLKGLLYLLLASCLAHEGKRRRFHRVILVLSLIHWVDEGLQMLLVLVMVQEGLVIRRLVIQARQRLIPRLLKVLLHLLLSLKHRDLVLGQLLEAARRHAAVALVPHMGAIRQRHVYILNISIRWDLLPPLGKHLVNEQGYVIVAPLQKIRIFILLNGAIP